MKCEARHATHELTSTELILIQVITRAKKTTWIKTSTTANSWYVSQSLLSSLLDFLRCVTLWAGLLTCMHVLYGYSILNCATSSRKVSSMSHRGSRCRPPSRSSRPRCPSSPYGAPASEWVRVPRATRWTCAHWCRMRRSQNPRPPVRPPLHIQRWRLERARGQCSVCSLCGFSCGANALDACCSRRSRAALSSWPSRWS